MMKLSYALCLLLATCFTPLHAQTADGMFAPGRISDGGVFGLTLSPDGSHALWVRSGGKREVLTIVESHKVDGKWQAPTAVPFSASPQWKDIDPAFSPDGKQLIFQSTRPVPGEPGRKGFDIWSVAHTAKGWEAPRHLGNVINTDVSESSASIASNGNIYFHKALAATPANSDLWVSRFVDGAYQAPENLGAPINTGEHRESNPFIAPDEHYLVYFSSDPRGLGEVDLYISFRRKDGSWGAPKHIEGPINTPAAEFTPWVHGGRLFLTRQVKQGERMIEDVYSYPFNPEQYADTSH